MPRVRILISSDRAFSGEYEDLGGPALEACCRNQGWEAGPAIVCPDDVEALKREILKAAEDCDLLLISGGTGVGPRDVTPEAVAAFASRALPGFGEMMRARASTPFAILSRSGAWVVEKMLVLALPGKPSGAVESVEAVAFAIPHALSQIQGGGH